jgi:hypothetical protein
MEGAEVDGAFVSLRDGGVSKPLSAAIPTGAAAEAELETEVAGLVADLRSGHFPVSPVTCMGCAQRPVCRIPRPVGTS